MYTKVSLGSERSSRLPVKTVQVSAYLCVSPDDRRQAILIWVEELHGYLQADVYDDQICR